MSVGTWKPPDYPNGTLADVMPGCFAALGLKGVPDRLGLAERLAGVRRVVVLLIDGMGWHQLPVMAPVAPGIAGLDAQRISCGFPSTTPTSLVSLTTGAVPGSHGVLAFTSIIPGTERVLNHTIWTDDPIPDRWQPVPPLFIAAAAQGIDVAVVNRPEYVGSGLSTVTVRGAAYYPASNAGELADGVLAQLAAMSGPALIYGYHPELDKAGHGFGVDSPRWQQEASDVDGLLGRVIAGLPADAALVVTADHGQLNIPLANRIDIDADDRLTAGVRVVAGEPRVRYLHTVDGAAPEVLAAWREIAGHAAWIGSREEAIATGWYGPVDRAFEQRIGDVVVVCRDDWGILATRREHESIAKLVAMHGSLTELEVDIPLLVVRGG